MPEKSLHAAFLDELRDIYDAEKQLVKALPKLAENSTSPDLRNAFQSHLTETEGHVTRLERAFEALGETAKGKHCDGIAGIIDEGKKALKDGFAETTRDAVLIGAGQRAEHYEMAVYGTLVAWAKTMGHSQVASLLQQNLAEEEAADRKLTELAESGINTQAAQPMSA